MKRKQVDRIFANLESTAHALGLHTGDLTLEYATNESKWGKAKAVELLSKMILDAVERKSEGFFEYNPSKVEDVWTVQMFTDDFGRKINPNGGFHG